MNIRAPTPVKVVPPGEILREELESRGWSQIELAEILDRPPRLVSEIILGKRAITPETAMGLEAALGMSAQMWLNLESAYQLSRTQVETSAVERRARLYRKFPIKELLRRKWVQSGAQLHELETAFCKFFGIQSMEQEPAFQHAAKKHYYGEGPEMLQLAWLIRAEQVAKGINACSYSVTALRAALKDLKPCMRQTQGVKDVARILGKAGVRVVAVEWLPGAKIDGACFWINNSKAPVIALSLRLDRIDNFWHTLLHEVDHIIEGEGKSAPIVDLFERQAGGEKALPRAELRANASAANICIPARLLEAWIAAMPRIPSKLDILKFAEHVDVHPGIVVGQLQHRDVIPYSYHRDLLGKVRALVIDSVPTDGFGSR